MELKSNFIDWACSLSGCDGGNPKADIWICGIEWGCEKEKEASYYQIELAQEIAKGRQDPSKNYEWMTSLKNPYGRNLAKLYSAVIGKDVSDYRNIVEKCDGSEIFKMNLYPIAFNNTVEKLWKEYSLNKLTGFEEKNLFKTWCFLNRFPVLSNLVNDNKPRLIIGTGISYLTDYFVCFASKTGVNTTIHYNELEGENSIKRTFYWAKLNNGTTLVVIPFFSGPYGLNSDYLIQETGLKISKLLA